jgi:hypothetical protein
VSLLGQTLKPDFQDQLIKQEKIEHKSATKGTQHKNTFITIVSFLYEFVFRVYI